MPWENGPNMHLGTLLVFRRKAGRKNEKDPHPLAFWLEFHSCFRFGALETLHSHLQEDKGRRGSLFRVQVLLWPSQNNSQGNTVGPQNPQASSSLSLSPLLFSPSFLGEPGTWMKFSNTQGCINPCFSFPSLLGASLSVKKKVHKPDLSSTSLSKFS